MEKKKSKVKKKVVKDIPTIVERFRIFGMENQYEYDLILTKEGHVKTFDLYATDNEVWSDWVRGNLLLSIIDDGNGIKFGESFKDVEYHEAGELRLLLNFNNYYDKKEGLIPMEYIVIPESEAITL